MEWKDVTASEYENEADFKIEHDGLAIRISRRLYVDRNKWLLTCHQAGLQEVVIAGCPSPAQAQQKALDIVKAKLAASLRAASKIDAGPSRAI